MTPRSGPPRARKRFGQHFLAPVWARKVAEVIAPEPGDVFLEIGPGRGALTLPLAASGAPILAVEVDRDLVADLTPLVPANVTVVSGDVMKTDVLPFLTGLQPNLPPSPGGAPPPRRRYRLVGNLPYNLSTPILFRMLEWQQATSLFHDATIMLQREVADRLAATPGTKAWGALSLYLQIHARITTPMRLPPGAFSPPPKVHSAIARLQFHPPAIQIADHDVFDRLVRTMFSLRRKTLSNVMKALATGTPGAWDAGGALAALASAGIDPQRRPETLTLDELAALTRDLTRRKRPAVL